jgi:Asp-tRNA(Asn)/Glu-tRNA(Gln) amidotransferase A subunit family amidase
VDATDLCYTPATDLRRMLDAKVLSPVELADAVIARVERLNPVLNAFLTFTPEIARAEAKQSEARLMRGERLSPIDGIPYSIKDLEPTAGVRTTFGSKWFEDHVPTRDGVAAGRLRRSGGVFLGKTNTPHNGYKDMCDNLLGPPCQNPWKLGRTSGASSGGAGAAVAAGLGPLAHGSDGAGSVRIPAALCGIFGMKPQFGRVPYAPAADYWGGRSHIGPMTRTVRDAAMLLSVMAGPDPRDPLSIGCPPPDYLALCDGDPSAGSGRGLKGLRVVWSADLGTGPCDPEVREIARRAALRFAEFGATVEERDPDWPDVFEAHKTIYETSVAGRKDDHARERPEWIEATMLQMIENARQVSAIDLARANLARTRYYDAVLAWFEDVDLLLTPQMPVGAWSAEPGPEEGPREIDGRPTPTVFHRLPFTWPFNLTNQPAATVPCGFSSEGLPVGLQIVGKWHDEGTVFRAAACFEEAQPWAQHRPPLD